MTGAHNGADEPHARHVASKTVAVLGFAAGVAITAWVLRKRIREFVSLLQPYARQAATIEHPVLIVNRWSGDGKAEQYGLVDRAQAAGIRCVMLERGDDLTQLAHEAIDSGADAIGMAGGDGSLGLVAAVAVERDVPFFCVPVGTRNHFALDLGLDRDDPMSALRAVSDPDEVRIDYGLAGDRLFLNNVSLGVYGMAVHTEGYRAEKAKTMAETIASMAQDPESQPSLRFRTPDGHRHERSPLILVSNNKYVIGYPDVARRARLDSGALGVGTITTLRSDLDAGSLTLADVGGLREWETAYLTVDSDDPIQTGLDGEAVTFAPPLKLSIKPQGLRVLVPAGTRPGFLTPRQSAAARLLDLVDVGGSGDDSPPED